MARHFDVADLESVAGIVARGILPRMKLASESLATEGPPAPPRRDEDVEAEHRANARRLLAAAPEMLEALRGGLAMLDSGDVRHFIGSYMGEQALLHRTLNAIRAAIAKAEGRTP